MPSHPRTAKAVRRKYNFLARIYDIIYWGYVRKTNEMACQPLSLTGSERLLNIGCGTGDLEKRLVQKYPRLNGVGVDISADMLRRAREKLSPYPNMTWREGDFLTLDFEENHFDAAFSISNFHYFYDPSAVFAKVSRLLKKGGQFILIDWNRNSLKGRIYNAYMRRFDPAFARVYTPDEVSSLLAKAGFVLESVTPFRVGLFWVMMRIVARKG